MADIKIRISLNKGRTGIPLDKLGNIAYETQRYLKLICRDIGIPINKGEWIATNFENGSLIFDNNYVGQYDQEQAEKFNKGMLCIASLKPGDPPSEKWVNNDTIAQYAKIATYIDADEQIDFGIYENGDGNPKEWRVLTRDHANQLIKMIQTITEYFGTVNGMIHALFKGTPSPHFKLRDSLTGELIDCYYREGLYKDIVAALERRDALVNAFGLIKINAVSKKIVDMAVKRIKAAPTLSEDDYDEFFGCAPDITCEHLYDDE